jgi:hypothetical protein
MSRGLRQRIEKLEGDQAIPGIPRMVVATCPMPERDDPPTKQIIERWLASGVAHIAFKGRALMYNGGRRRPLTRVPD